jgi:hypothetical protein
MNTDTITDRVIVVDYGMSLPDIVEGTGTKKFRAKIFHFGRHIWSRDAVAAMKAENFLPASNVHRRAFGAAFPEEERKYPIAYLGSSAQVSGILGVVHFFRRVVKRDRLYLSDCLGGWEARWRFLGVREVSDAWCSEVFP